MKKKERILIVDDERGVRESFNMVFKNEYNVFLAENGSEAIDIASKYSIDVILLDIMLPDSNGLDLIEKFKEIDENSEIVMITAVNEVKSAVKAVKLGAYEYVIKPFIVDEVLAIINRTLEKQRLVKELTYLKSELKRLEPFEQMVGKDTKMRKVFSLISTIAASDGTALIQGESGTGKELVARAIHNRSPRKNMPFVVINCAAITSTLMEDEIFGHNKDAFTGATGTVIGKLEIADKGTAFLDDIDTLDVSMQAKLLRIIQEKEFERLGSTKVIKVDIRFIAASNKDLLERISEGKFREDLYYRLNVFPVKIPSLRTRREDIPLLLDHFMELFSKKRGAPLKKFSDKSIEMLMKYEWPGNVRELQNLVERLATITKGHIIQLKDISLISYRKNETKDIPLKEAVKNFERRYITETLEITTNNRTKAAEMLGIHRNTLLGKINELNIKT